MSAAQSRLVGVDFPCHAGRAEEFVERRDAAAFEGIDLTQEYCGRRLRVAEGAGTASTTF